MPAPRRIAGPKISPWWALLLLAPLPLLAGWFIADLPSSAPKPPPSAAASFVAEQATIAELRWTTLDDAMQSARRDGKVVLIDFNAEWCGPCQMLRRSVFDDADAAHALGAMAVGVSVVDRVREDGQNPADIDELQRRYEIRAFPTLIVLSPKTGRMEKLEGFMGPAPTMRWILGQANALK